MNETLIFYLREARKKAKTAALQEALCLLHDLNPAVPPSGPFAEQGGVFWLTLPEEAVNTAESRLPLLGYTQAVDLLEPMKGGRKSPQERYVQWRKQEYRLVPLYQEDENEARDQAPDRRNFWLETGGKKKKVKGYRGDGTALGRRGLPVADARLLVNLVIPKGDWRSEIGDGLISNPQSPISKFLDPFAGVGGLAIEAVAHGWQTFTCDHDPALRHGLAGVGAVHCVAHAARLPFADRTMDSIATEPPYERQAEETVIAALGEMVRVLRENGRLAILCAAWQADGLRQQAEALNLRLFLDCPIDRKGTDCVVLAWEKGN